MHNSFTYRRTRRMFLAAATGVVTMQLILVGAAFGQTWNVGGRRGLLRRIPEQQLQKICKVRSILGMKIYLKAVPML
jgi:hypothetical protein